MERSAVHLYRLVILRIEDSRCKIISLNGTNNSLLNRSHFCLNSSVAIDRITNSGFLTTGIEPSAEHFAFCDLRQYTHFRQHAQRSTLIGLLTSDLRSVLVFEDDLTRNDIRGFREEIRYVCLRAELEGQHTGIAQIHVGHVLIIVRFLFSASFLIADRCVHLTVFLHGNVCLAMLTSTDGKFHHAVHRHRDRTSLHTVLTAVVGRAIYHNTIRQTGCGLKNGIRIIAELNLEVHKCTRLILNELNLLQHSLCVHTTAKVDIVLLCRQLNNLCSVLGLLTGGSVLRFTFGLRTRVTAPVPYLHIGSVATATRTKTQFQLTRNSRLGKAAITRAVQLDTLQTIVRACRIIHFVVEIQPIVRTATRSCLRVIP